MRSQPFPWHLCCASCSTFFLFGFLLKPVIGTVYEPSPKPTFDRGGVFFYAATFLLLLGPGILLCPFFWGGGSWKTRSISSLLPFLVYFDGLRQAAGGNIAILSGAI